MNRPISSYTYSSNDHLIDYNLEAISQQTQQEIIIQFLKKQPTQRLEREIRQIIKILRMKDYFKKIKNQNIFKDICSKIGYKYIEKNSNIYEIGDHAKNIYIIIQGEVDLIAPVKVSQNQEISIQENDELENRQAPKQNKIIKTLKPWQVFGEISLRQTKQRSVTARAQSQVHLIQIDEQEYNLICEVQVYTQNRQKYLFISKLDLFKKVYRNSLESFIYYLQTIQYGYNHKVYLEGDKIQYIYIVLDGSFQLDKIINPKQSKIKTKKHQRILSSHSKNLEGIQNKKQQIIAITKSIQELRVQNEPIRKRSIKIIGKGQILGDTQTVNNFYYFQDSCLCVSQVGIMLRMPRKIFLQKILSSENNIQAINESLKIKLQVKQKQIAKIIMKHSENVLFTRYLPSSKQVPKKDKNKTYMKTQFSESSINGEDFFKNINQTFLNNRKKSSLARYQTHKSQKTQQQRQKLKKIPATVADVVRIVNYKRRYQKMRNFSHNHQVFKFDTQNVPVFILRKFDHLVKTIRK